MCMTMFFVNLVKKDDVFELKFICNDVCWSVNEFGDDFGVDDFLVKLNVVFQTHVHAFSITTLTGFVFWMLHFFFGSREEFSSTTLLFLRICEECCGNGEEFLFEKMVNSSPMNSPTW